MAEKKKVDYNPVTAQVALHPYKGSPLDDNARELAEEAGVVNPAHVDYEEALKNYESRDDVETLAHRRAREGGASFSDADFVRTNSREGVVTAVDVSKEDVEAAEQSRREQAKAVNDRTADVNEPVATVENDEDDKGDDNKKSAKKK